MSPQTEFQKLKESKMYPACLLKKEIRLELANGSIFTGTLEEIQDYRGHILLVMGRKAIAAKKIVNFRHVIDIEETINS